MKSNEEYLDDLLQSVNPDGEEKSKSDNEMSLENLSDMDMSDLDALLKGDEALAGKETKGESEMASALDVPKEDKDSFDIESLPQTEEDTKQSQNTEENSMLAQLMAEMQEESFSEETDDTEYEEGFAEDIDALLNAAKKESEESSHDKDVSFDAENADDLAEIEALLNMSDGDGSVDENMELLRMLEEQEKETAAIKKEEPEDVDVAQLEEILTAGSDSNENQDVQKGTEEEKKEKKEKGKIKNFFKKIVNVLLEEVSEEEEGKTAEEGLNLSEENKEILEELDQEEEEKVKVKEKKAKKEKPKKPKKEKPKKEKKAKVKVEETPEKKLPKKKVILTAVFAFSIFVLILLLEIFAVPRVSLKEARKAFDGGDYYEAYKEYYGHNLSEEDEVKFEAATVIMRMQSNMDAYQNYMNLDNKVYALHSLLEAVHIKHDAFFKAEEFGVLSKVETIYNEVLEILNSQFHISETEAMEIVEEESDAVYTRRLEALADGAGDLPQNQISGEDILPEEEAILED